MMDIRSRILPVAILILATPSMYAFSAFAQTPGNCSQGTPHICIDPIWTEGGNVRFKVTFVASSPHIDYTAVVKSKAGDVIFDAAKKVGQNTLHTADGAITFPQEPDVPLKPSNGDYIVNATIYGVQFQPVTPVSFAMPFTVTPEFPMQMVIATAGFVGAAVVVSRIVMERRKSPSL